MIHPAKQIPYQELIAELEHYVYEGLVGISNVGDLTLFCYTKRCVYDNAWDRITTLCRGLIFDIKKQEIVALPFPKFFNIGQAQELPNEPFEVFEKIDGSLIILFYHDGEWRTATKGSLSSIQSIQAKQWLDKQPILSYLDKEITYLCEWVGPQNRIVIEYKQPALVLLAAYYTQSGKELNSYYMKALSEVIQWPIAGMYKYDYLLDLVEDAKRLPKNKEGFVIRYNSGLRVKVKGEEYLRIHRLISHVTPLSIWECMRNGDNLELMRKELPEEFWGDFDKIVELLTKASHDILCEAMKIYCNIQYESDKEVGLKLNTYPKLVRSLIFPLRNANGVLNEKARKQLYDKVRPTGNVLPGYIPTSSMTLVLENME